jgi:hypothetical protein
VRRSVLIGLALVCELTGWVWILQGVGVLPGSFMSGQALWTVIGAILVMVASVLFLLVLRSQRS